MTGISRGRWNRASWLCLAAAACGGRAGSAAKSVEPTVRIIPLARAIVLETAGPPPADTSVTFNTGESRVIVIRHGPPENVEFAELSFAPNAFKGDSGHVVRVEVRPRPGVYGLDVNSSVPFGAGASVTFKYARYFSAPALARSVYGSDVLYERALAVGQVIPNGPLLALLPSTRPAADNLKARMPAPGTYLAAAPE